jgi:diguanylate cyclase (GGDEF)-like protein
MATNTLVDIIQECMAIDRLTVEFYNRLSGSAANPSLKRFWDNLAEEGGAHLTYWDQLLLHAKKEELPQVFDDPEQVKTELLDRAKNMKALIDESEPNMPAGKAFNFAYRLESYKLHPAFRTLFRNFNTMIDGLATPDAIEDATITRFSEVLRKQSLVTPELRAIGDTLQIIWEQNRYLTEQSTIDEISLLHNRRGFMIMATQLAYLAKRNKTSLSILMTDITDIKRLVEGQSRMRGNDIVRKVAATLRKILRGSDLIARYSNDTFIALLPDTSLGGGEVVAQKVQQEVRKIIAVADTVVNTVVVQANITDDVEAELHELIREAEYKLIVSKSGTVT